MAAQTTIPAGQSQSRSFPLKRIVALLILIALVVAMVLSTKFLTPSELAAALPKPFDPQSTATDLYSKAKTQVPAQAKDLGEVLTAIQADPKAAAAQYKAVSPATDSYTFAVKTTGTVIDASAANLRLKVPGAPPATPILVPLGTAVNGTVLRDAMGFKFADAPGQTDFQYVGDELKKLIQADIKSGVSDPASLTGKKVQVVGVISVLTTNGTAPPAAKPVNVQPIELKAAS
jgi:predicted lipoprotein